MKFAISRFNHGLRIGGLSVVCAAVLTVAVAHDARAQGSTVKGVQIAGEDQQLLERNLNLLAGV